MRIVTLAASAAVFAILSRPVAAAPKPPSAAVSLTLSSATMTQTSDTAWTLEKTGTVDANSVTWEVTATQGATVAGLLVVNGQISLTNSGNGGATIGNFVVNLQTRFGNSWVAVSSDVADATSGDAATSAQVVAKASSENLSLFTENAASGQLLFTDAATNATFSLVPQVTIPAGATRTLLFSASFDNNVLNLATGTKTRVEIIGSFGNASDKGNSAANVDINGNGVIDPDETHVRSVSARLGLSVPAPIPNNATPTLSDTLADITTTGTVTFSNPDFNLGATSGTVTVSYDGGADGGTLKNCAHLTGGSLDLEACDTQTIDGDACTPGTPECPWRVGDMTTYVQAQWGDPASAAAATLATNYGAVYMSTGGHLEVGISGPAGFSMVFNIDDAVQSYLPQSTSAGALTSDLINPTISSSGVFGGEVVALQLNVDFSDAGYVAGTAPLGDLRICGFSALPAVNNLTVRQVLGIVNQVLGGGTATINVSQAAGISTLINSAFADVSPSPFAQDNLVNGSCGWQAGDMLTFNQNAWGEPLSGAGMLLGLNFDVLYGSGLEVGISGVGGFSMTFSSAGAVFSYLPAIGVIGTLTADLLDPTSSSSGSFGGSDTALVLNIAFSDAGIIAGASHLGDLRICGFSLLPAVNGLTVRQFSATSNTILGGGAGPFGAEEASAIANMINNAFIDGNPSVFAQDHLVNGSCGWQAGDMVTYDQGQWGDPSLGGGALLVTSFNAVYGGLLEVGLIGAAGFSMSFTLSDAVLGYLPATGPVGALTSDLLNPTSSPAGLFGGELAALQLNVDFSDAGLIAGTSRIGDLRVCNFGPLPVLNGQTVRQFLASANTLLGGGSATINISQATTVANFLNAAFADGSPSAFAQENLVNGACP